jgi:antitoxin HicB
MDYPALFESAKEGGFVVTFRDIPEAITQGDTLQEAEAMALDVLISSMDFYFEDKRTVPLPSKAKRGERLITLPPSVAAKVFLLNEMLAQGVGSTELARRLGMIPQEANRLVDFHHKTKIDTLANALAALGKRMDIVVV